MIKNLAIGGGSNRLLLILALVLGLLAAVLVGVYLSGLDTGKGGSGSTSSVTVPVVVATQDIPAATTITEQMVAVRAIPSDLALVGAFTQTSAAIGQTTQIALVAGEQIVTNKVASASTAISQYGPTPPLSVIIPQGSRAFSIEVSAVGAAGGLIRPGDHVDVLMSNAVSTGESGQTATGQELPVFQATYCFVLQDIQVLAVGAGSLSRTTSENDANGIAAASPNESASTMTLAVSPSQAGTLASAQAGVGGDGVDNQLWVALRNFSDHAEAGDVASCNLTQ